jgi:maltooligosyltrehalose trehalohydrolase
VAGQKGFTFRLWAPEAQRVELVVDGRLEFAMSPVEGGYFVCAALELTPGTTYQYRVDGKVFPDPASRFQPEGVHGPSALVDPRAYDWRDQGWSSAPQEDLVFYETHVGTFSAAGTFAGVREKLSYLKELGITALELMPVADFPGRWNWGYDGAALFAPSRAYGTPDELRALVDEAHSVGLAVFLDVVYNHLGPDGAYLPAYSPFVFSERHHTAWGRAINFDGPGAAGVRRLFIENALHWLTEYHADGLRLDATFAIFDDSKKHFLAELAEALKTVSGRLRVLVAEDSRNWRKLIEPPPQGMGLQAVWADDFHHQMRRCLAGDERGYYQDFSGSTEDIATTINHNWFFTGQFSHHEGEARGTKASDLPPEHFVYCLDNHDQVGNRPFGDRLSQDLEPAAYRAASALLLFLPQLPLLFAGQEWAAETPFLYFTDHAPELGRLVSAGRKDEFKAFAFPEDVPDPQDPETFKRSKLDWGELELEPHQQVQNLYRDLLSLRRELQGDAVAKSPAPGGLEVKRGGHMLLVALKADVRLALPAGETIWSSEVPEYATSPVPPRPVEGGLEFSRPAAIIARSS